MDLFEAMKLELKVTNEIVNSTRELIANYTSYLNPAQVRTFILKRCSKDDITQDIARLFLHSETAASQENHNFGSAPIGTRCAHPMGCNAVKLTEEEEGVLIRLKLSKLLHLFSFQEEHLLPASCGGEKGEENMEWWCQLHNRQKSDELAWYISMRCA